MWDKIRSNIVDDTRLKFFGKDVSGRREVDWDDPWGDNVQVPYRGGKPIRGARAEFGNEIQPDEFRALLYRMHTGQKINRDDYTRETLQRASNWYREAEAQARDTMRRHRNNTSVVRAQKRKLEEVNNFKKYVR